LPNGLKCAQSGPLLDLSDRCLCDEDLALLLQSPWLGLVHTLNLSGNRLTAAGMEAIARSENVRYLRALDVSRNPIGNAGLAHLPTRYLLWSLESLNVRGCGIKEAGWKDYASRKPARIKTLVGEDDDKPIDWPVWRAVAEVCGEGYYAGVSFRRPYPFPFPSETLVVCDLGEERDGTTAVPHYSVSFRLCDFIAHEVTFHRTPGHYCNLPRWQRGPNTIADMIQRFDRAVAAGSSCDRRNPLRLPYWKGLDLARNGVPVARMWCSFCNCTFDARVHSQCDIEPTWCFCPEGHFLAAFSTLTSAGAYWYVRPQPLGSMKPQRLFSNYHPPRWRHRL
jgi:hypothetical protein